MDDPTSTTDSGKRFSREKLIPRTYQIEILERAKVSNTLAFLPTASGKTLISVLLIAHRLAEVRKRVSSGLPKQCVAFIAPTR